MNAFEKKLVDKLSHYHDAAPVYRIEPHSLDELERSAAQLANRVAGQKEDSKSRVVRGNGRSDLLLADGFRARVYHPSGAIAIKAGLAPMEHLIGERADKKTLTDAAAAIAKRLGLDRLRTTDEKLAFERLWQIKAAGINRDRVRGHEVVCRAIGAFRRYLGDLPVWGRASVVVELAGGDKLGGVGLDWRPIAPEPIDRAKVLDPERGARAVIADLNGRLPGGEFSAKDFDVALFSLGYISMPKRRAQGIFAPIYVALLERRAWTTMNHVVVVNGSEKVYEEVCRLNVAPPKDTARRNGARGRR
jgi:hypothetical protein